VDNRAAVNRVEIHNPTSTPLYVLSDADEFRTQMGYPAISWADDDLGAAPSPLRARLKVENNIAYGYPYWCAVDRCVREWFPLDGPLVLDDGRWGLSVGFEERIPYKKSRPADVGVPAAQQGSFTLSYGGRVIELPFVVIYELNRTYDPAVGTENCGEGLGVALLAFLVGFVALLGGLVFAIRTLTKRAIRAVRGSASR
jgi:hypothetical protein